MSRTPNTETVRNLTCCCCGAIAKGRQWHNRDTGYGFCSSCAERHDSATANGETSELYGIKGYHYAITDVTP